jgi:cytochrome c oxidase cbb3-type subunit 3
MKALPDVHSFPSRARKEAVFTLLCALTLATSLHAADQPGEAPFLSNCAFCHGVSGRGGRGPSLVSARIIQNTSDDAIKNIIKNGIPGTSMPAFDMEQEDREAIVLYIRHLGGGGVKAIAPSGNPAHGIEVYKAHGCADCHRIGTAGSVFGPELSRIGSARSPEYLRESIINPSADIAQDYDGATVETLDGKRFTGVRINEDSFFIQLRLQNQQFAQFDKAELGSVKDLDKSLMPAFTKLSASDLNDLAAYLGSLRGDSAGSDVTKAQGIH